MNNPFDYVPSAECDDAFARLVGLIEQWKGSDADADIAFCRELDAGKMMGVLIAEDSHGVRHTLYAFSGQFGEGGFFHDGFVGPVFDYLAPDGHFKTMEREISRQTREITQFEQNGLKKAESEYYDRKALSDAEVEAFREKCRQSKRERDARRMAGCTDETELAAMIRQSQYEKAELHRLKKRMAAAMAPFAAALHEATARIDAMKRKRSKDSEDLQQWLFSNFKVLNARGESKSLSEIFSNTAMKVPPSGAGECCAPKLLQAAYLRGWLPVTMAEYWYGAPKDGALRIHGQYYPACRGKCLPILNWMLQGLEEDGASADNAGKEFVPEIIFENEWFCVADKPSGMLTVPGKDGTKSLEEWLVERYGVGKRVKVAHRLDRDTSGLVVAAFGDLSYKILQTLFAMRKVEKTYVAVLDGDYRTLGLPQKGSIDLPVMPDYLDRPRQKVDRENGKQAITEYEFTGVADGHSRVIFHPLTGRTHQLRVHAASAEGLGIPILGDPLYGAGRKGNQLDDKVGNDNSLNGNGISAGEDRLHLHAHKITFTFPADHRRYSFVFPIPF